MNLPDWDAVEARLEALGVERSAAGCHGLLCGLLAVHAADAPRRFAQLLLGAERPPELLGTLYEQTREQLDDETFEFQLLLPGDDADLEARTRALGEWCDGFVFGVGAGGHRSGSLPGESEEFLRDAMRIAEADAAAAAGESDESALAELIEYVRVGVLLMRTECARSQGH